MVGKDFPKLESKSKKLIIIVGVLILVIILAVLGFFAYQRFVLKKEVTLQLLLISSQKIKTVLISALVSVLLIVAGVFGYVNYKRHSPTSVQKKKLLLACLILILAITSIVGSYFSYQYYLVKKAFGPQLAAQEETRKVIQAVGKLILLPDETPTIATITDINKLKDQTFFSKAKNGDKILIYANAKEAILYSPSSNLILGIAPVTIGGGQAPSQSNQAKIGLRNGTDVIGLTYRVETEIERDYPGANIVLKEQGKNTNYDKTLVIPISDAAKSVIQDLAKKLNATVSVLPANEANPQGIDILIIVGKDKISS